MHLLVSIIVPVYKVEQYLDRCVNSIVSQTYQNLEIILVDDGSPDSCGELCDLWANKDSRIHVIHKTNGGLSDARNAGAKIASGEYILFVDSDDWIAPEMVEKMTKAMEQNNADMVICQFYSAYPDGRTERHYTNGKNLLLTAEETISLLLEDKVITNHAWRKMYKKKLLKSDCFPAGVNYEDIYAMPELILACQKIYYLDEPYYFYFRNESSITGTASYKNSMDHYKSAQHSYSIIKNRCPALAKKITAAQAQTILVIATNLIKTEKNYHLTSLKRDVYGELRKNAKELHGSGLTKKRKILFLSFKISPRCFLMLCWIKDKLSKQKLYRF